MGRYSTQQESHSKTQGATIKTTRFTTHWDVSQADAAIEFLDVLRDALWESYGEQIIAMRLTDQCHKHELAKCREHQIEFEFEYDIPF